MTLIPSQARAWIEAHQLPIWSAPQAPLLEPPKERLETKTILAGELPVLLEEAASVALIERSAEGIETNVRGIEHAIEVDGLVSVAYSKAGGYFGAGDIIEVRIRWAEVER